MSYFQTREFYLHLEFTEYFDFFEMLNISKFYFLWETREKEYNQ